MRDRVSIISWIYPETSLFYLSLFSGAIGLFILLIISLRRPGAANWVKVSWRHSRKIMIVALFFDLLAHGAGFFYWQLISVEWLMIQVLLIMSLIFLCYNSERLQINLTEFPQKVPEK